MALTGIPMPRSFSADSLVEPRWNQLPTSGVVSVPPVQPASSSGAVSEPYTSIGPPRVHCPLPPLIPQIRRFEQPPGGLSLFLRAEWAVADPAGDWIDVVGVLDVKGPDTFRTESRQ